MASQTQNTRNLATSKVFSKKRILLMYRPSSMAAKKKAQEIASWLRGLNAVVFSAPGQTLGPEFTAVNDRTMSRLNLALVLGGDGTYLGAVRLLGKSKVPILGVNMGSLGFLTETRLEDLHTALTATLSKKMDQQHRSMLSIRVLRGKKLRGEFQALNDLVIERGSITHLINIEIFNEQHFVGTLKADALIVATPTGSTAYNLAAGGPVLHPDAKAIVVTPVCPHALTSRPLIFPDDQRLRLRVLDAEKPAILTIDGVNCGRLAPEDEVEVLRHTQDHIAIRKPSHNFFQLLREKLRFGERS